jgi:putative transposase
MLAEKASDVFLKTYKPQYPKATACWQKDREELLSFYAFPAANWQSLRTKNPIESAFGTIRHRTTRTKGCLTRGGLFHMMFIGPVCGENVATFTRIQPAYKSHGENSFC